MAADPRSAGGRGGGRYTLANVVPACRSCNASKCNLEVTGWLRRKRLDEAAFLLRHREIVAAVSGLCVPGSDAAPPAAASPDDLERDHGVG
jgi:hypothetical protein